MSVERPTVCSVTEPAMGAEVTITTDAPTAAVRAALTIVSTLERRWSRFSPSSEISIANRSGGAVVVHPLTAHVIEVALAGRAATGGWFDPTRGAELVAAGYGRTFTEGWGERGPTPRRHRGEVTVDADTALVGVPAGISLDLGGIAKGWAADLAATTVFESGAAFVGVDIGGDVRVRSHDRAIVDVVAPGDEPGSPMRIGLRDGGVAVSGPTRRRDADGRHHLIDPFTGAPSLHPRVAVVVAASAAGAEMLATAAAIAPLTTACDLIDRAGATAWLVEANGDVVAVGRPERFVLDGGWLDEPARREWVV